MLEGHRSTEAALWYVVQDHVFNPFYLHEDEALVDNEKEIIVENPKTETPFHYWIIIAVLIILVGLVWRMTNN